MTKRCSKCGETKPVADFFTKSKGGEPRSSCKACAAIYEHSHGDLPSVKRRRRIRSRWLRRHDPDVRQRCFESNLRSQYGLTFEQYETMWRGQNGLCCICGGPILCGKAPSKKLAHRSHAVVDHDHQSRKVRGLLCWQCNAGLGNMQESPDRLRKAAAYLEQFI